MTNRFSLPRRQNRLLDSLSDDDRDAIAPHLVPLDLPFRKRLEAPRREVKTVYFPEAGLASVVAIGGHDRPQAEVAIIGHEGMTGIGILLDDDRSPHDVLMQVGGSGHSIEVAVLKGLMKASETMAAHFRRFVHAIFLQAGQTALANARGKLEVRLARWLLMSADRLGTNELPLTHEFLAIMMGVRRAGVTIALNQFERHGVVSTSRGTIRIEDRETLVATAGGFYGVAEAEYERLFPAGPARNGRSRPSQISSRSDGDLALGCSSGPDRGR